MPPTFSQFLASQTGRRTGIFDFRGSALDDSATAPPSHLNELLEASFQQLSNKFELFLLPEKNTFPGLGDSRSKPNCFAGFLTASVFPEKQVNFFCSTTRKSNFWKLVRIWLQLGLQRLWLLCLIGSTNIASLKSYKN